MEKYTITITSDKPISVKVSGCDKQQRGLLRLNDEIRSKGGERNVHRQKKIAAEV